MSAKYLKVTGFPFFNDVWRLVGVFRDKSAINDLFASQAGESLYIAVKDGYETTDNAEAYSNNINFLLERNVSVTELSEEEYQKARNDFTGEGAHSFLRSTPPPKSTPGQKSGNASST